MAPSEHEKMAAGQWYCCIDPELEELRIRAREAVQQHNTMAPGDRGNLGPKLRALLNTCEDEIWIEAPFHCAYGMNLHLGRGVYINAGCVILDTAAVMIGASTMLGPAVQIYCAEHHLDPVKRTAGLEIAKPVTIGERAWIGGGAIIMPGVSVGDEAVIGAGSVVTRNVGAGDRVAGNPARSLIVS